MTSSLSIKVPRYYYASKMGLTCCKNMYVTGEFKNKNITCDM